MDKEDEISEVGSEVSDVESVELPDEDFVEAVDAIDEEKDQDIDGDEDGDDNEDGSIQGDDIEEESTRSDDSDTEENLHMNEIDQNFSDDEDDLDEDYLQKMDKNMKQNIVDTYHHELKIHNADEIDAACVVVRNADGYIVDPMHRTLPFITCYEKARVLGERAKQLEAGAKSFVEIEENVIDSYLIALREYQAKKIPFILQRPLPNGVSEYWKLCDLELLD